MDVHRIPRQRVIDDFALLESLAFPQVKQLLGERFVHLPPEHAPDIVEQHFLAGRAKHAQRLLVDVDDTYLLHAPRDKFRVHLDEGLEVVDPARPHPIEQRFHGAEILHPQRYGGVLEQIACIPLAAPELEGTLHLRSDVFQGNQYPPPVLLVARQHAGANLYILPAAIERIVDGLIGKLQLARPQCGQLMDDRVVHVIPENLVQIGLERVLVLGGEQLQRSPVDFEHLECGAALAESGRILREMDAQIRDALGAPSIKKPL